MSEALVSEASLRQIAPVQTVETTGWVTVADHLTLEEWRSHIRHKYLDSLVCAMAREAFDCIDESV